VQVDAVLAERFAVIGNIDHRACHRRRTLLQLVDDGGNDVVRVEDRVVVDVGDFLRRATAEVVGVAIGFEASRAAGRRQTPSSFRDAARAARSKLALRIKIHPNSRMMATTSPPT
jgi:hypothetical protein